MRDYRMRDYWRRDRRSSSIVVMAPREESPKQITPNQAGANDASRASSPANNTVSNSDTVAITHAAIVRSRFGGVTGEAMTLLCRERAAEISMRSLRG